MDETERQPKPPEKPEPPIIEPDEVVSPPHWQEMIYPERRWDPLRWLRH
jgi:hypothetical protein